jgi:hypothetical protein
LLPLVGMAFSPRRQLSSVLGADQTHRPLDAFLFNWRCGSSRKPQGITSHIRRGRCHGRALMIWLT